MKPFSPLYFIRENKSKCILLIFMLFLGYAAYFGGLYVSNPMDNWRTAFSYEKNYILTADNGNKGYADFLKEISDTGKIYIIYPAATNGMNWNTIMGFESGYCGLTFRNTKDLEKYLGRMGITYDCDSSKLKSGTMLISRKLAANRGYSVGDKLDNEKENGIQPGLEFEIVGMTDEDGYFSYSVKSEEQYNGFAMLMADGIDNAELYDTVHRLNSDGRAMILQDTETQISAQYEIFDTIYMFIIILLAVIMAVTVNAAFVGTYQRRTFEFAVYRAIGISKKRIIGKLVKELLIMDLIALVAGGAVFFLFLFLFNELVLYPVGLYLCYYHPLSLIGLLVCNLTIMVPLIITRCRQMLKADICEF